MVRFIFIFFFISSVFSQEISLKVFNTYSKYSKEKNQISLMDSLRFNTTKFIKIKDSLVDKYSKSGYFNLKIDSILKNKENMVMYINFGNKFRFIKIAKPKNEYLTLEFEKKTNFKFLNGFIKIKIENLNFFITQLKNSFEADGFSFVTIQLINFQVQDSKTIRADIVVKNSSARKIDRIVVKGYSKMSKSFLNQIIFNKKPIIFNKNSLQDISARVNRIPFIKQVKKPEVLFTKDSTIVYVYLDKVKNNYFDGLIGFSENSFNGYLDLYLNNLFDYGETFEVKWNKNIDKGQDLSLSIIAPYFLKSPAELSIKTQINKRDSTFLQVNSTFGINYQLHKNHIFGLVFSVLDNTSLIKDNISISSNKNFRSKFYGLVYTFFKKPKNDYLQNDLFFTVESSIGSRTESKNKETQYKVQLDFFKNWNLFKNHFLTTKFKGAKLFSENYLPNETYMLGGENSIRGIKQNSLYVTSYTILSIEYRIYSRDKSYLYPFSDMGSIYTAGLQNFISLGLGYSFKTKSGRVKLAYAVNKIEEYPINKGVLSVKFKTYF